MTKDEALKLALETLENSRVFVMSREMIKQPEGADWYDNRITAIKEALAQTITEEHIAKVTSDIDLAVNKALAQPEQEPVARVIDNGTPEGATEWIPFANRVEPLETGDLLYTTPPQRPWVGLTGQEKAWIASVSLDTHDAVYRTDVKLKEKNT